MPVFLKLHNGRLQARYQNYSVKNDKNGEGEKMSDYIKQFYGLAPIKHILGKTVQLNNN